MPRKNLKSKSRSSLKSVDLRTEIGSSFKKKSFGSNNLLYVVLIVSVISLGVSIYTLSGMNGITGAVTGETIEVEDFMSKVTSHTELSGLGEVAPTNIVQINSNNLAQLQGQIEGLNVNHIGKFLIQYPDRIVVYDYAEDIVEGQIPVQQGTQLPDDFEEKLYAHQEIAALAGQSPVGGALDAASLKALQEQFPEVYKNAKEGDFLLRYPTALVIYDYVNDQLINVVPLEQG